MKTDMHAVRIPNDVRLNSIRCSVVWTAKRGLSKKVKWD